MEPMQARKDHELIIWIVMVHADGTTLILLTEVSGIGLSELGPWEVGHHTLRYGARYLGIKLDKVFVLFVFADGIGH